MTGLISDFCSSDPEFRLTLPSDSTSQRTPLLRRTVPIVTARSGLSPYATLFRSSQIEMRELEMQREFDAILNMRDREIEQIKFKYKNFWQVYEDLMERHTDLEKLRVGIAAKMGLVQGYDRESIKCMKIVIEEIDVFNRKIESLECRANKLIPER